MEAFCNTVLLVLLLAWAPLAAAFPYSGFSTAADDTTLLMAYDGTSYYYFYSSRAGSANVVKLDGADPGTATAQWTKSWNLDGTATGTTLAYEDVLAPHDMYVANGMIGLVAAAKIDSSDSCEAKRLVVIKLDAATGSILHESEAPGLPGASPTNNLGYMSNAFCNNKIYSVYAYYSHTNHPDSYIRSFDLSTDLWTDAGAARNTTGSIGGKALFIACGETGSGVEGTSMYLSGVSARDPYTVTTTYGAHGMIDKYDSSISGWKWVIEGRDPGPNSKLYYDENFKKADGTQMILSVGFEGWGPFEVGGGGPASGLSCIGSTTNMGLRAINIADGTAVWSVTSGYPSVKAGETTTWPISQCTDKWTAMYCPDLYGVSFTAIFLPSGDPVIVFPYFGDFDGGGINLWTGNMDIVFVNIDRETGAQLSVRQVGSIGDDYVLNVRMFENEIYLTALTLGAGYQSETHQGNSDIVVDKIVLVECPRGQYFTGNPPCSDCPAGTYSDTEGALLCKNCLAGSTNNSTRSGCDLCPAGTHSATDGSATGCVACQPGSFSPAEGSTFCSTCSSGSYASGTGNDKCSQCALSHYQPDSGQSSCIPCPETSDTLSEGSSDAKLCQCATNYFGNPTGSLASFVSSCVECPEKTECERGQRWPAPAAGRYLNISEPLTVYECSPKSACPGGDVDLCADGYQGEGCVECAPGYTREFGECQLCPTDPPLWQILMGSAVAGVVLFTAGMGLFCFGLWKSLVSTFCQQFHDNFLRVKKLVTDLTRTVFKYGIRYIQIMSIALSLDVQWPSPVGSLSIGFDTLNSFLVISNFVKVDCLQGIDVGSATMIKLILQVSLLLLLLFMFMCGGSAFWCCSCITPKCARKAKVGNLVSILMQVLNVLYLTIHQYAITVFSCYEQVSKNGETTYRLVADPTIRCYVLDGSDWTYMLPAGLGFFIVVSCGLPLLFGTLIWLRTRPTFQRDHFFMAATVFLVDPYKDQYKFMEIASLAERFLIPLTSALAPLGAIFQTFYLTMVTIVFILVHWRHNAFALYEEWVWIMQVNVSILVTMIVAVSLAREPDTTTEGTEQEAANLMTSVVYISAAMIGVLTVYSLFAALRDNFCKRQGVAVRPAPAMDGPSSAGSSDIEVVVKGAEEAHDPFQRPKSLSIRRKSNPFLGPHSESAPLAGPPTSANRSESSLSYSEGLTEASPPTGAEPWNGDADGHDGYALAASSSPSPPAHPKHRMVRATESRLSLPIPANALSLRDLMSSRRLSAKPIAHPPPMPDSLPNARTVMVGPTSNTKTGSPRRLVQTPPQPTLDDDEIL